MVKNYGLPYKGSKNLIAKKIVDMLPPAENFYDVFCGGCAITHAAMESGKYQNFYVNDIIPGQAQFFVDVVNGKYREWYTRWISREEFKELKDTNTLVRLCWSFGNGNRTYLYAAELEPYKRAFHFAAVENDCSAFNEMGISPPPSLMNYHTTSANSKLEGG